MDVDSHQVSGRGSSQSSGGGHDASGVIVGSSGSDESGVTATVSSQPQAVIPAATPIHVSDEEAASDEDLDQEWVNKAKDIVERTKADPFTQSNELNKVKAEYLKARFGKELNVGGKSSQ